MKRLSIAALCILVLPILVGAARAASTINLSLQNLGSPTDQDVPLGEVPGYVQYRVFANDAELQELFKLIARDKFNSSTDGTFLVTLALTAQAKRSPSEHSCRALSRAVRSSGSLSLSRSSRWVTSEVNCFTD